MKRFADARDLYERVGTEHESSPLAADALYGLASTALSDYRQLRSRVGLQRYGEDEMIRKLAAAGFSASRARSNIGHNPWRTTFVARQAFMRGAEQSG